MDVPADRGRRALTAHDGLDQPLEEQLGHGGEYGGERQAPLAGGERDERHDRTGDQDTQLLERPEHRVQRAGKVVDRVKDAALRRADRAVADRDHPEDEDGERGDGGDTVGASTGAKGGGRRTVGDVHRPPPVLETPRLPRGDVTPWPSTAKPLSPRQRRVRLAAGTD